MRSATSANASLLGIGGHVGQIKPGFVADLIVVSASPFDDIHNIAGIECVVRGGATLPFEKLKQTSAGRCGTELTDPITRDLLRYLASTRTSLNVRAYNP